MIPASPKLKPEAAVSKVEGQKQVILSKRSIRGGSSFLYRSKVKGPVERNIGQRIYLNHKGEGVRA